MSQPHSHISSQYGSTGFSIPAPLLLPLPLYHPLYVYTSTSFSLVLPSSSSNRALPLLLPSSSSTRPRPLLLPSSSPTPHILFYSPLSHLSPLLSHLCIACLLTPVIITSHFLSLPTPLVPLVPPSPSRTPLCPNFASYVCSCCYHFPLSLPSYSPSHCVCFMTYSCCYQFHLPPPPLPLASCLLVT